MDVWVATAGYAYPAWVGPFYPPAARPAAHLAFYARHFPAVEINSSFYRPPTPAQADRMAARVPAGFRFAVKVPRSASHAADPADLPAFRAAADRLAAADKLLGLVVQFPEAFRNRPDSRRWVVRVRDALRPLPLAAEFRHLSWDVPALPAWLARHDLGLVSVGVPDLPALFPPGPRPDGRPFYARLHSDNPDAWYAGGPARYDFDYPDRTLEAWADGLARAADQGCPRAVVVFNNCVGVQAVRNARRFADLVRRRVPAARLVPPPPPADRSLFDDPPDDPGEQTRGD